MHYRPRVQPGPHWMRHAMSRRTATINRTTVVLLWTANGFLVDGNTVSLAPAMLSGLAFTPSTRTSRGASPITNSTPLVITRGAATWTRTVRDAFN